jgi:hypothetical protein
MRRREGHRRISRGLFTARSDHLEGLIMVEGSFFFLLQFESVTSQIRPQTGSPILSPLVSKQSKPV